MKSLTEQERQELIDYANCVLAMSSKGGSPKTEALLGIALAALTAEPVAWEVKGIFCHTKEEAEKFVGNPEPLYECPPAPIAQEAPEWSNAQCLEFLAVAFRHCRIIGDIEMDDIRLGVKMAAAPAPGGDDDR